MIKKIFDGISPILVLTLATFVGLIAVPLGCIISMFSTYDRTDAIKDSFKTTN